MGSAKIGKGCVDTIHSAKKIDVYQFAEDAEIGYPIERSPHAHAGAKYQEVQRLEPVNGAGHEGRTLCLFRDICLERQCRGPETSYLSLGFSKALAVPIGKHERYALSSQVKRKLSAES
jgi:hypothetical protein